jgi:hypothetical protein
MIRTVSYQYPVSTPPYIPDPEVYQKWMDAVCRPDGMTLALVKARQRLAVLLTMKPETVEAYMATLPND